MRTIAVIVALSATAIYATPVAQNGRWQPEWETRSNHAAVGAVSASSAVSALTKPASSAPPTSSAAPAPVPAAATGTAILGIASATPNPPANPSLVAQLDDAPTAADRFTILRDAVGNGTADFKFDFNPSANPGTPGLGGEVILANRGNFPVLTSLGVGFAGLFFAPCGLNTPHIHPRATEVLTLVTDGSLTSGFVLENNFNMEITETLTQYQGMAFPQGSIHWQLNTGCTPQVAIAGFNSEDPGASSIAQNFFNTNPDVVRASLGFPAQITPDNFAQFEAAIPRPFAIGIQECYAKCGIMV